MSLNTSSMLMIDVLREKFSISPGNPFVIEVGPFQESSEGRLEMHYELEVGILLEGRAKRYYPGYEMDIMPGQVWFCGIWEPHSRKTVKQPCCRVFMSILPQTLASIRFWPLAELNLMAPFMVPPKYRPQISDADREAVIQIGRQIEKIQRIKDDEQRNMWYLLRLLEVLLLAMKGWTPPVDQMEQGAASDFMRISRAIHLVMDSQSRISEQAAAAACRLSKNNFTSLFENLMGISFSRFALNYRISRAAWQLVNTDEQIKKIASEWGFADSSHFIRCFTELYGASPQNYRSNFSKIDKGKEKKKTKKPLA